MVQEGKEYSKHLSESEYNNLYFVGDAKNPVAIGKKGEIFKCVDDEFWHIYDQYRWHKSGINKLDISKDDLRTCAGVRVLMEVANG